MKGVSQLISTVLIFLLTTMAIGIALSIGTPTIDRAKQSATINEAIQNMKTFDNLIREVASEGKGSFRTLQMRVIDGEYKINQKTNTIEYMHTIKSGIIESGTFFKDGNVFIVAGTNARASKYDLDGDGSADMVLENEIMRVALLNNDTAGNVINTSKVVKFLNLRENGRNITINDSRILIDNRTQSYYGRGFTELVREGDNLATAEAVVHINSTNITSGSAPANFSYDIVYSLRSGADFLIVKIQNISDYANSSNIPTFVRFQFDYKIGGNKSNDVFDIGTINETIGVRNVTRQFSTSHANLTERYGCTYNTTDGVLFSLIHSGKSDRLDYVNFTSTIDTNNYNNETYTLAIRQKIIGSSLVIPFTKGNCKSISDNFYLVEKQDLPSRPFATYALGGEDIPVQIYTTYDRLQINGTDRFRTGSNKICISNEGVSGGKPLIWARLC